ncbi:MAG: HAMP domain-containing histidine kinase [Actinobacteria bacterium]|nr:MAG: HAMP domain-containing histidine kinase [Actinomycetota bacterium]
MLRSAGLGLRLAVAFAGVALFTAGLAGLILTSVWQRQFNEYVLATVQERADDAAAAFAGVYADAGTLDSVRFVDIGHYGMSMRGFRLRLYDEDGALIADSPGNQGVPFNSALTDELDSPVAATPIVVGGRKVGEVRVSSLYPGQLLTERDIAFRSWSLVGLLVAAVVAVLAASGAGVWFSRSLVRPIERVTAVAARMREGDLDARTGMDGSSAVEGLGRTLDEMADAIAEEREFERRLTADVAHELRTPLQAIQATVEAMQDGVLPADEERLGTVREETMRLARLTDGIMDLSRLESRSARMRRESVDLSAVVAAAVETHRALMESAGLTMSDEVVPGVTVTGDADRLRQAIGNLLSNAARYTPEGGAVSVSLAVEDGSAVVRVRDSGIGIAPDDLPHVFTRFWRADPARQRSKGGLGIGLAVVREIAERHCGTVAASSDAGGAEFVLRVPLAAPAG